MMKLTVEERRRLRDLMDEHTSLGELNDIAKFELDVDPDNIAGATKAGKIRELISYSERHDKMLFLITSLLRLYPFVPWPRKEDVADAGKGSDVLSSDFINAIWPTREVKDSDGLKPLQRCDMTTVSSHLATITALTFKDKSDLADLLLAIPTIGRPQQKQTAVNQLPANIRYSISPGDNPKHDVVNIIDACLNHAGGLVELINIIHFFEQESKPMIDLCQFALTLKNTGQ